jgi:hypothetical protein
MFTRIATVSLLSLGLMAGSAFAQQRGSGDPDATGSQRGQTSNCQGQTENSASRTSGGTAENCN